MVWSEGLTEWRQSKQMAAVFTRILFYTIPIYHSTPLSVSPESSRM